MLGTAFKGNVVVVGKTVLGYLREPVGLVAKIGKCRVFGKIALSFFVGSEGFKIMHEVGVHELHALGEVGQGGVSVVGDVEPFSNFTGLGGDDDNAGRTAGTVNGGCRCVLKDGDFLDGFGSYGSKGTFNAVHQD